VYLGDERPAASTATRYQEKAYSPPFGNVGKSVLKSFPVNMPVLFALVSVRCRTWLVVVGYGV
jgi:hypothetical protein